MSKKVEYKGYIINSNPLPLQDGGFSSNGSVEKHYGSGVRDIKPHDLQSKSFADEKDADDFYITEAKKSIDNGLL